MGDFQFRFADSDETVMSVTDLFVSSTGNFHIITLDRRLSHRKQMVFVSTPRCGQGFRFRSPWILSVGSGAATFLHPTGVLGKCPGVRPESSWFPQQVTSTSTLQTT